jgi:hypothetical protein
MLCKKLKDSQQQRKNSINQIVEKESIYTTKIVVNEVQQENQLSIQIQNLKQENDTLKEIINQAAISIADVIQVRIIHIETVLPGQKLFVIYITRNKCIESKKLSIVSVLFVRSRCIGRTNVFSSL